MAYRAKKKGPEGPLIRQSQHAAKCSLSASPDWIKGWLDYSEWLPPGLALDAATESESGLEALVECGEHFVDVFPGVHVAEDSADDAGAIHQEGAAAKALA